MSIDLDTLHVTGKNRVQKSISPGYASILHVVPMQPRTKVQKSMQVRKSVANKPKQSARKADMSKALRKTPDSLPVSTIGNNGHPNATSNLSGAPAAKEEPSGIDAVFAAINTLAAAVTIAASPKASTANMDAVLRASRAEDDAEAWNASRSAAQRQGFTYHAAKGDNSTVSLGKSAHTVRMQGNKSAPAPMTARKAEERKAWFNDSYMARLGRK
ncbi:hypothetical protein [Arenimonas sp. SCN 70-307]|uniref:hypothetical protein n=1 Tax=Arenimonas sp. SCN 70-307 TaxID=1660089 RepID=UPI0025BE6732|nr:hypothetical protein [Arenimonas sp. SCN 70-307]